LRLETEIVKYLDIRLADILAARLAIKNIVFFTKKRDKSVFVISDNAAIRPKTTTCASKSRPSIPNASSTTETRLPVWPVLIPVMDKEPMTPTSKTPNKSKRARNNVIKTTTIRRPRSLPDNNLSGSAKDLFFNEDKGQIW